jgi:porin
MQVASNIDAGNHTYVQELWYSQTIGNTELILGLQDLNAEFANTEYGSFYMNSSFGIMPLISNNLAAPIFPLTTLGFTVKWHINQKLTWLNALYDGCPSDFDTNPYNLSWKFSPGDGLLTVSELQYNLASDKLPGTYKLGIFTHNHILEQTLGIDIPQAKESSVLGFYAHADQILWHKDDRFFALFAQLGYSPTPDCVNNYYFGLGLNYQGIFSPPGKDMLGIAIAHERLCEFETAETTWEFSYRYDFSAHFFVQPNLIHIVHPLGTGEVLANSTSLNLRLGLSL